jgi:hypothetical protein
MTRVSLRELQRGRRPEAAQADDEDVLFVQAVPGHDFLSCGPLGPTPAAIRATQREACR